MTTSHFLRMASLSGNGKLTSAGRHNKRMIQRELGASGHIDATKSALNYCLRGEASPEAITAKAKAMREAHGITKLRKNAVQAIEVIFSLPVHTSIDTRQYFTDCCDWVADELGAENILSADVHLDEAAPHSHVLIMPLRNGRMAGSEIMGNRQTMQARQTAFYETVAKRYGLDKPQNRRLSYEGRQTLTKTVLAHLRAMNDASQKSQGWAVIRDHIEQAPQLWANCLGLETTEAKPKKMRTMVEIFTSKGKGSTNESTDQLAPKKPLHTTPIGKFSVKDTNSYALLGVCAKASLQTEDFSPELEVRERESEQTESSGFWDESAGEWVKISPKWQDQKASAQVWVNGQIQAIRAHRVSSRDFKSR